jgi:hypothetical protein
MRRPNITGNDLMDGVEVADAFGVSVNSLHVAMSRPDVYPALSGVLPAPIRKIGKSHVWLRYDIERAVKAKELAS